MGKSKTVKRLASLLVCVVMVATLVPMGVFAASAETIAGNGTIPHVTAVPEGYTGIYSKSGLDAVRNSLNGNYILMNDIEFTESDFTEGGAFYNNGKGWEPIGSEEAPFTGTFDGNGYAIKNLYINNDTFSSFGLFGYVSGGEIKNLGMENSLILAEEGVSEV